MRKRNIILLIIILTFIVLGCSKENDREAEIKQDDKTPESLQKLNKSLDETFDKLGEIERIDLDIDLKEEGEKEEENEYVNGDKNQENNGNEEENNNNESNEDSEDNNEEESNNEGDNDLDPKKENDKEEFIKSEKTKELWTDIDKLIEEIHSFWNIYEVEGIKKGGSSEKANQFDDSINKLTKAVEDKNIMYIYDYGSQALLNLKPFLDLYVDDYKGEIAEVKYGIYQYYLRVIYNKNNNPLEVIQDKDENIQRIKSKVEEDEEKIKELDRISYALKNLANSLEEDSKRLYIIKKDMVIKSIYDLEEY